jgi:hypothetical protein
MERIPPLRGERTLIIETSTILNAPLPQYASIKTKKTKKIIIKRKKIIIKRKNNKSEGAYVS